MTPERSFSSHALPGRVVFGAGSARSRLPEEIERLGADASVADARAAVDLIVERFPPLPEDAA